MNKHWVKQAIGNDTSRPLLNKMFVSNGWLYATDCHRLHRIKTKLPDAKKGDFPNVEKTFEEINAQGLKKWEVLKFEDLHLIEVPEFKKTYFDCFGDFEDEKIIRPNKFKIDGQDYQAKYIMQAFAGHAEMEYMRGLENMLYLRSLDGQKEAVVMRIK